MPRNLDKSIRGEGTALEIDPPEPDWLDPPRPCGHEWRNNDFTCMDCVERRIARLENAVRAAIAWFENEPGMHRDSAVVRQIRNALEDGDA